MTQCDAYHNQCVKDFRDCLTKFEILCSSVPKLVVNEIFVRNAESIVVEMRNTRSNNFEKLSKFDVEKVTNESMLKPNLGHPNMKQKLDQLDKKELHRQSLHTDSIASYIDKLKSTIGSSAYTFLKELSEAYESLLLRFDDLLTEDDVFKPELTQDKHPTGELIRRQKAGLPLEDGDPQPLIHREKGNWKEIENFDLLKTNGINIQPISASVSTAKTTLAHKNSSDFTHMYNDKFKDTLKESLDYLQTTEKDLYYKSNKWINYWKNSINQIKELYN